MPFWSLWPRVPGSPTQSRLLSRKILRLAQYRIQIEMGSGKDWVLSGITRLHSDRSSEGGNEVSAFAIWVSRGMP